MAVYLDDEAVGRATSSGDLAALLDWATAELAATDRLVVEVEVDGCKLLGDALEAQRTATVNGREVRLYSADRRELIAATLAEVRSGLGSARTSQSEAAGLLQQDKIAEAMTLVARVIEAWQNTQAAVLQSIRLMGDDLERAELSEQDLASLTGELIGQLKTMRSLLESGDTVSLADALAYEWPETIDRWDRLLASLIGAVEKPESKQ